MAETVERDDDADWDVSNAAEERTRTSEDGSVQAEQTQQMLSDDADSASEEEVKLNFLDQASDDEEATIDQHTDEF